MVTGVDKTESAALRHTVSYETLRVLRALPEPKPLIVFDSSLTTTGASGWESRVRMHTAWIDRADFTMNAYYAHPPLR